MVADISQAGDIVNLRCQCGQAIGRFHIRVEGAVDPKGHAGTPRGTIGIIVWPRPVSAMHPAKIGTYAGA